MIQYDRTQIEIKKAWYEKHYGKSVKQEDNTENIRISENISWVFRMFLLSMVFIVFILWVSS